MLALRVDVGEPEARRNREVDLVRGQGELAADCAPYLDVDLGAVERGFVGNFGVVDAAVLEGLPDHRFGFNPQLGLAHVLLAQALRTVGAEPHLVFLDAE